MDENSTSNCSNTNSQPAAGNDDVYEAHCNMLSSSSISSQMSGDGNERDVETGEDLNSNTVDSSKSVLDPAVMDDTARDTLISFPTMNNNSNSKQSAAGDASDEGEFNDGGEDAGEIVSAQASDDGELMSDDDSDKKEESEGELKSSEDEQSDDDLEEGEEGEVIEKKRKRKPEPTNNNREEDLEEGEVSEEDLKPKSICRFFGKGQCTWGNSCRFLHPGVTDKGFYSMFDRPALLPHPTGPPLMQPGGSMSGGPPAPMYPKPGLLGHAPPNYPPLGMKPGGPLPPHQTDMLPIPPQITVAPIAPETAWERGLRLGKEMLKQSAARKETDIDFEDKKMNQSLNEDLDKENETDFYIRKAGDDMDHERDLMRRREFDPTNLDVSRERMNHRLEMSKRREAPPRDNMDDEMMVRRKRREAPPLLGDEKPPRFPGRGPPPPLGADDEWHDPWMRNSSYHRRPRRRSRSESYSSESDRRHHPSSGSESSPSRNRRIRKAPPRNLSPKPMRIAPPKEEPFERGPTGGRPDRVAIKRRISRSRSRSSSRSSSSSASSASSAGGRKRRDSWSSSSSSASKSSSGSTHRRRGHPSKKRVVGRQTSPSAKSSPPPSIPPARQQTSAPVRQAPVRPPAEKKRAQVKMTLKEPGKVKVNKNVLDKLSDEIMGKDDIDDDDDDSLHSQPQSPVDTKPAVKKKAPGRREELLKQLKAVEDAIAKKRSKIL